MELQQAGFAVKDLIASYGSLVAVRDLSVSIGPGEFVGIFGHNGSGKSTFMKCLVGGVKSMSGTVRYGGAEIAPGLVHINVRLGIAVVPQSRNVFPSLTVEQCLRIAGLRSDNRSLEPIFEILPVLKERRGQRAGLMSGGEQQMLAIGMALMTKPQALLLDEPTAGLSPVAAINALRCLKQLNERFATTIVIVEQNVLATLEIVDRAIVLRSGQIVYDGKSGGLASQDDLWSRF